MLHWLSLRYEKWIPQKIDYPSLKKLIDVDEANEFHVVDEKTWVRLTSGKNAGRDVCLHFSNGPGIITGNKWRVVGDIPGEMEKTPLVEFDCNQPDLFDKLANYIESEVQEDEWEKSE